MKQLTLITGASSGFGAAIAKTLAKDGFPLLLLARRQERLDALKSELSQLSPEITLLTEDIRDRNALQTALAPYTHQITNIVNNAGLALGVEPAEEASLDEWENMVQTNILGLLYVTHTILPEMVRQKRGTIVNIGSVAGNYPYPGGNVYGATKAFVKQFSLNLRADLLGKGVRVTNIEPGASETEFSDVRLRGDSKKAKEIYAGWNPITADNVAEAVRWVISQPPHVNINSLEIMGTEQAFGPFQIAKCPS